MSEFNHVGIVRSDDGHLTVFTPEMTAMGKCYRVDPRMEQVLENQAEARAQNKHKHLHIGELEKVCYHHFRYSRLPMTSDYFQLLVITPAFSNTRCSCLTTLNNSNSRSLLPQHHTL